jgi:chromosome segregation ATPase
MAQVQERTQHMTCASYRRCENVYQSKREFCHLHYNRPGVRHWSLPCPSNGDHPSVELPLPPSSPSDFGESDVRILEACRDELSSLTTALRDNDAHTVVLEAQLQSHIQKLHIYQTKDRAREKTCETQSTLVTQMKQTIQTCMEQNASIENISSGLGIRCKKQQDVIKHQKVQIQELEFKQEHMSTTNTGLQEAYTRSEHILARNKENMKQLRGTIQRLEEKQIGLTVDATNTALKIELKECRESIHTTRADWRQQESELREQKRKYEEYRQDYEHCKQLLEEYTNSDVGSEEDSDA